MSEIQQVRKIFYNWKILINNIKNRRELNNEIKHCNRYYYVYNKYNNYDDRSLYENYNDFNNYYDNDYNGINSYCDDDESNYLYSDINNDWEEYWDTLYK